MRMTIGLLTRSITNTITDAGGTVRQILNGASVVQRSEALAHRSPSCSCFLQVPKTNMTEMNTVATRSHSVYSNFTFTYIASPPYTVLYVLDYNGGVWCGRATTTLDSLTR